MQKICETCGKENKSNYLRFCNKCYVQQLEYYKKVRECPICNIKFKGFGKNCYSCARKIREEKSENKPCSKCQRTSVKIIHKRLCLCTTCFRKKKEIEIPGEKERRILYNRQSHRKYRGKEPFGPLQKKPAGAGHINKLGYVIITKVGHPNSNQDKGAIPEHVFVMSEYLKRPLKKGENVHHKNGIRHDNCIENLELWHKSQPCGQRVDDKIDWAIKFLNEYGYQVNKS